MKRLNAFAWGSLVALAARNLLDRYYQARKAAEAVNAHAQAWQDVARVMNGPEGGAVATDN